MNTTSTPPVAGTSAGGGTTRTLERDVKVGATVIVALLLMGLVWQIAWDVTAHLVVTYSEKLIALRLPFFLIGTVLIGAGAASFIAKLLGKSFRNVIFDKRNLRIAQWVVLTFAGWEAIYAYMHSGLVPPETMEAVKPYSMSIALGIIALILYGIRKGYSGGEGNTVTASSASAHSTHSGGRKRFSLAAAVWTSVGLALFGLLILKAWHEFEFGLSNAPERMAARGYVPRESVAAAAPALPEVHTITAPPLGADGMNWGESVIRESDYHHLYFNIPDDAEPFVVKRADGAVTNFSAATRAKKIEFGSRTNAITVKWWQSKRKLTPQEIAALEEK